MATVPEPSATVARFAADADAARTRIAVTIDEIQDRLNPRRIAGDAFDKMTGGGLQLAGQARDVVRAHPLALGAAVAAIGLAVLARRSLARATVNLGDDLGAYTDYDDGFGFAEARPQRIAGFDDDGEDAAGPPLKARVGEAVDASPVVSIALGLAAGAVLGMVFPATETERRALGETGSRLGAAVRRAAEKL